MKLDTNLIQEALFQINMRMGLVLTSQQFNKILNKTNLKTYLIQYTTLDNNDVILILTFISNKLIEKDWKDEYFDLNHPEYTSFLLKAMDSQFDINQNIKEYLSRLKLKENPIIHGGDEF